MSERNIGQMIEMLRESSEERPDFERKSQEIINNLKQERVDNFIKAFCLAKLAPKKRKILGGWEKSYESKIDDVAESLDDESHEYYIDMKTILTRGTRLYKKIFPKSNLKNIYSAYLDGEITVPKIDELRLIHESKYENILIIPGQPSVHEMLGLFLNLIPDIGIQSELPDQNNISSTIRPTNYYTIAVKSNVPEVSVDRKFTARDGLQEYTNFISRIRDDLTSKSLAAENIKMRGLTLQEYLFMQIAYYKEHSNKYKYDLLDEKIMQDTKNRSVLLGSWYRDAGFLTVSCKKKLAQNGSSLELDTDRHADKSYYPWLAIAVDEVEGL